MKPVVDLNQFLRYFDLSTICTIKTIIQIKRHCSNEHFFAIGHYFILVIFVQVIFV